MILRARFSIVEKIDLKYCKLRIHFVCINLPQLLTITSYRTVSRVFAQNINKLIKKKRQNTPFNKAFKSSYVRFTNNFDSLCEMERRSNVSIF